MYKTSLSWDTDIKVINIKDRVILLQQHDSQFKSHYFNSSTQIKAAVTMEYHVTALNPEALWASRVYFKDFFWTPQHSHSFPSRPLWASEVVCDDVSSWLLISVLMASTTLSLSSPLRTRFRSLSARFKSRIQLHRHLADKPTRWQDNSRPDQWSMAVLDIIYARRTVRQSAPLTCHACRLESCSNRIRIVLESQLEYPL